MIRNRMLRKKTSFKMYEWFYCPVEHLHTMWQACDHISPGHRAPQFCHIVVIMVIGHNNVCEVIQNKGRQAGIFPANPRTLFVGNSQSHRKS